MAHHKKREFGTICRFRISDYFPISFLAVWVWGFFNNHFFTTFFFVCVAWRGEKENYHPTHTLLLKEITAFSPLFAEERLTQFRGTIGGKRRQDPPKKMVGTFLAKGERAANGLSFRSPSNSRTFYFPYFFVFSFHRGITLWPSFHDLLVVLRTSCEVVGRQARRDDSARKKIDPARRFAFDPYKAASYPPRVLGARN